ncbi:TraR/DksA family transcriptional regulator [Catellatospora coxensis]
MEGVDRAVVGQTVRQRYEQSAQQLQRLREQSTAALGRHDLGTGDAADAGTAAPETAEPAMVASALQEQLQVALVRLDNGLHGTGERCCEQIPVGRLTAMPWAAHCVPCQGVLDRHR